MLLKFLKWLAKRNVEGIVKSQYGLYEVAKRRQPNLEESEICMALFRRRFERRMLSSTRKEKERIKNIIKDRGCPDNIFELCLSIAQVEFNPQGLDEYFYVHDIILQKLNDLGYKLKIE